MHDQITITIDCNYMTVQTDGLTMSAARIGDLDVTRSHLIGLILQPYLHELMGEPTETLKRLAVTAVTAMVTCPKEN